MDGPSQINPQKANCTFKSSKHNPFDRKTSAGTATADYRLIYITSS